MRVRGAIALAALFWAALGGTAQAKDLVVRSFDGTPIVAHWFPNPLLEAGERAPVVLNGPGWSSPGEKDPSRGAIKRLHGLGYNVLTWDPRGFGVSGGEATIDAPQVEGRDVKALITRMARQPEVRLDRRGDPRVGMTGGSYGGGIQFSAASIDRAHRRHRPGHRLELARDQPLQGPHLQAGLERPALPCRLPRRRARRPGRRARRGADRRPRPPHHLRVRERHEHRPVERRGRALVPRPRPRRQGHPPHHRAHHDRRRHRGHALSAGRGRAQLQAAEGARGAGEAVLVLRRARGVRRGQRRRAGHRARSGFRRRERQRRSAPRGRHRALAGSVS